MREQRLGGVVQSEQQLLPWLAGALSFQFNALNLVAEVVNHTVELPGVGRVAGPNERAIHFKVHPIEGLQFLSERFKGDVDQRGLRVGDQVNMQLG